MTEFFGQCKTKNYCQKHANKDLTKQNDQASITIPIFLLPKELICCKMYNYRTFESKQEI